MSFGSGGSGRDEGGDDAPPEGAVGGVAAGRRAVLIAAYDARVVTLIVDALKRLDPAAVPHVADAPGSFSALLSSARPVLTVVDLNLIDYSPRDLVAQTRTLNADARVIVVAGHGDDDRVLPALRAGAAGFLLKHDPPEEVTGQLRRIMAGFLPVTPALARQLLRQLDWTRLSGRLGTSALELLAWISLGDTPAEAAGRMRLDRAAVRQQLAHVFEVLQLPGTAEEA